MIDIRVGVDEFRRLWLSVSKGEVILIQQEGDTWTLYKNERRKEGFTDLEEGLRAMLFRYLD